MGTALVGPLRRVRLYTGGGPYGPMTAVDLYTSAPDSDRHPAALTCLDHHLGCACREALAATLAREYREDSEYERRLWDGACETFAWLLDQHAPCHDPDRSSRCRGAWHVGAVCKGCAEVWPCEVAVRVARTAAMAGVTATGGALGAAVRRALRYCGDLTADGRLSGGRP